DSDAEDSARLDGIQPITLQTGDPFYLGLAVSLLDAKQVVQLTPDRARLLEYDISRAITRVMKPQKAVIGVMSALPVFGEQANPMMQQMGKQGTAPWELINELKGDYTVKQVPLDTDKIDDDIQTLLVIHPHGISDAAQFAIDQFVLRGGKLIAFLDPLNITDSRNQNSMGGEGPSSSTLDKLLKNWGITFDTTNVVADLNDKMQLNDNGQPVDAPAFLSLTGDGLNTNNIITSELSDVWLPCAGAFTGEPVKGLKETVLLKSTKDSELTPAFLASLSGGASIMNNFQASGIQYPLAIELTGKFKTAFPDSKPVEGTNAVAKTSENFLKESAGTNTVILVGDADMLADDFSLREENTPFGNFATELNGNLSFAQNAIEQLSGNSNLISIRSRGVIDRPFTRIKKMEAAAETEYQSKIKDLQDSLTETQQRLSELQTPQTKDQRVILSPEQMTEIQNFQKKEADVQKQLRQVQKNLRHDVDALQTRVAWINIAAMPILVSAFGIGLAVWKRKKTSAK
ncbi:MAG: Gldg family protein, partial [Limisphaerales bacterium]